MKNNTKNKRALARAYVHGNRQGFAMAEAVISMFILSVGLTAAVSLIAGSIRNSASSRDQIIASNLAQEGIELVRNMRDNNINPTQKMPAFCQTTNPLGPYYNSTCNREFPAANGGYIIDTERDLQSPVAGNTGTRLYFHGTKYTHGISVATEETKFYRKILFINGSSSSEKKIVSAVFWGADLSASIGVTNYNNGTLATTVCTLTKKCFYAEDILLDR